MKDLKQKYIGCAVLLLVSSLIVKLIGAVYKIPLTAFIGATGRGYFNTAYNLLMPLHALIMGALPVAFTHLVSKRLEKGGGKGMYKLKKAAAAVFFSAGALGCAAMLLLAVPYSKAVGMPKCLPAVFAMAPAVFFSAGAAFNRAFAEGHMDMTATAVGQIAEALFKTVFGLLFSKYVMGALYSRFLETGAVLGTACASQTQALSAIYPYTAAAAVLGAAVGALLCWVYCSAYVRIRYSPLYPRASGSVTPEIKELLKFSLPIAVSTLIQSGSAFLDNASVQYCLSLCSAQSLSQAYSQCLMISGTQQSDLTTYVYGLFSAANDIKMLFPGLTMALGAAAVPALTGAYESGRHAQFSSLLSGVLKYTCVIACGGGFFLALAARQVTGLLYGSENADIVLGCTPLVRLYGIFMLLFCLAGAAVYSAQAVGCASKCVPYFIAAAVLRVGLNFALVSNARFNIYGAAVSDIAAYLVILAGCLVALRRVCGARIAFFSSVLKPALCAAAACAAGRAVYVALFDFSSNAAFTIVFGVIYAAFLTIFVLLSKTIDISELKMLAASKKTA